ncbi:MAG TPA: hypothetical protein VMJ64_11495 [Anaerolineales bacterium]|nr:hypothetical protein [Anaerolineales bacterium]
MTLDQFINLPTTEYSYLWGGLLLLLLALLIVRARGSRFRKTWQPLMRLVKGKASRRRGQVTLSGKYHDHEVVASLVAGDGAAPIFSVHIPAETGGRNWEISRRSERLLGPERWRASSKDPAIQMRLEEANVAGWLQNWPPQTVVCYDAARGMLMLSQNGPAPSAEGFRAQLELLEALADVNRQINR